MPASFEVTEPMELLKLLVVRMPDKSRTAIKSLLARGLVSVDDQTVTQFNHQLTKGQTVAVGRLGKGQLQRLQGVKIILEDAHLIVIEKPAGFPNWGSGLMDRSSAPRRREVSPASAGSE